MDEKVCTYAKVCAYLHGTTALFQGRQLLIVFCNLLLGSCHCSLKPVHIGLQGPLMRCSSWYSISTMFILQLRAFAGGSLDSCSSTNTARYEMGSKRNLITCYRESEHPTDARISRSDSNILLRRAHSCQPLT